MVIVYILYIFGFTIGLGVLVWVGFFKDTQHILI
jgi:hypothetical protein